MQTTTGSFIGPDDVPLVGHEALRDTMTDFMLDGLGAVSYTHLISANM